jgi:hypothetical protein
MTCSFCGDGDFYEAPDAGDLADFVRALVAGDLALARILVSRIFPDAPSAAVCERAMATPQTVRAA